MKEFDTIAAISTSLGESGISIIRISGDKALSIVSRIFEGKNKRNLIDIKSYSMRFGYIINEAGEKIDEVLVSFMKCPKSYTAEDVVEINCHGGIVAARRILEVLFKQGIRNAEPGEFTKRAFLNGRIDLSQAEGIMDIINSKTELSMKTAFNEAEGVISKEMNKLREKLLDLAAEIEATVDFPEEDLETETADNVYSKVQDILDRVSELIKNSEEGKILREGLSAVIVGKPNVGKSSLLNALLQENRAIVTDIPGTTRDVIEEFINIEGIPVKVIDTAGIRETEDVVEKIGVDRTKDKLLESDLVILMLDKSKPLDKEDFEIINFVRNKKYIVLLNKSDVGSLVDKSDIGLNWNFIIDASVKFGDGILNCRKLIKEMFLSGVINSKDVFITNTRHREALIRAKKSLTSSLEALKNTSAIDMASIDIKDAWISLGEITGETAIEDVVNTIFAKFCVGK